MRKEQRFEIRYTLTAASGEEVEKVLFVGSEAKKGDTLKRIKEAGYKLISCKKLYPFSSNKNQHNFMLIANICANRMYDLQMTPGAYDDDEYNRLHDLKEKADKYFELPLPVAWIPWEDLKEAKELVNLAVEHRMEKCITAGRIDLLQYC